MTSRPLRLTLALLLLSSSALRAHDFWIEPSSFRPAPGDRVAVRLRVGERFKGDPVPRDAKRIERFAQVGADGERPVSGVDGMDPAGYASFQAPGLHWIVYDSSQDRVELAGGKFEQYLREEGLEAVSRVRAQRGQSAAPGQEIYSRCVKSLVKVGAGGPGTGWERPLGLVLELVPEADPYSLKAGGELPVRLLFRGKPLAGALVVAFSREAPDEKVKARSDAQGRVRLRLARPGVWLVKAVHMIETIEPGAKARADWESFWASVTFEAPKP